MQTAEQKLIAQKAIAIAEAMLQKNSTKSRRVNPEAAGHFVGKLYSNEFIAAFRAIYGELSYAELAEVMFLEAITARKNAAK